MLYTVLYVATRTQIYLTSEQRSRLDEVRRAEGLTLAELIREAVDQFLTRRQPNPEAALEATFGATPELEAPSREEWKHRG